MADAGVPSSSATSTSRGNIVRMSNRHWTMRLILPIPARLSSTKHRSAWGVAEGSQGIAQMGWPRRRKVSQGRAGPFNPARPRDTYMLFLAVQLLGHVTQDELLDL